jgi:integrase
MIDNLHKRGRLWWWKYRPHGDQGKTQDISLGTPDKQVAERRRSEMLVEKEREAAGISVARPLREAAQKPLSEHLEDLLGDLRAQGKGGKYLANIEHRVGVLIKSCGWKLWKDVTADSFQIWRKGQSLSAKTLNDYMEAARRLMNWIERHGRLVGNPLKCVEKVGAQGENSHPRRAFSGDEMKRLLRAVPADRKAIYLMAVHTGLRRSELASLIWGDLHLSAVQPFLNVRASTTKNHKPASMRLPGEVVAAMDAIRPASASDSDTVFPRFPRIERFKRDLVKAKVEYENEHGFADFHALRNTFCTNLGNGGVAPAVRQALMRHCDSKLTERIYTDKRMLATWSAIESLPSYTTGLSQGVSQSLGADGLCASSAVIESVGAHSEKMPMDINESQLVALNGTSSYNGEIGGSDGARSRPLLRFH